MGKKEEARIIMVTSHGQEEMVIAAIKAGARGYVLKPVNAEKLSNAIKRIFPNANPLKTAIAHEEEEIMIHEEGDGWSADLESLGI